MADLAEPIQKSDHIRGNQKAPVILVEYGDYQCPYCGEAYWVLKDMLKKAGEQVGFVYRNFPLTQEHEYANQAARAAEAAGLQGKFWEMHDMLFEHQDNLEYQDLLQYAEDLHLNKQKFEKDMESEQIESRVHNDFLSGVESGVNGTPTFFINGNRYDGEVDEESLLAAIQAHERRQQVV